MTDGEFEYLDDNLGRLNENSLVQLSQGKLWELVASVRQVRDDRVNKYRDYQEMTSDPLIRSAMELMCDDATQFDEETNHVAWVTSANKELELELNLFLHNVVDVDTRAWSWAFDIVKYGETFLRTYITNDGLKSEWIFEQIPDPQRVSHIIEYNKEVGYVYDEPVSNTSLAEEFPMSVSNYNQDQKLSQVLYPPEEFVHFISDRSNNRAIISMNVPNDDPRKYKIVYGTSFIEGARSAYQVVRLLEDVMVLARVARSTFYRLVKVEVGKADPHRTRQMIDEVRRALNKKEYLDLGANMYKSEANPVAINDNVYIPTRDGTGDIAMEVVGKETMNLNGIVDIDYFKNKLFAALKVPKSYLGFEESISQGLGSSSLTRIDIRYARTIKRLQSVVMTGIKQMCLNYLIRTNQDQYKNDFDIKMAKIVSAEENARTQDVFGRVNTANSVLAMFDNQLLQKYVDPSKFLAYVLNNILQIDSTLILNDPALASLATDPANPPRSPLKGTNVDFGDVGDSEDRAEDPYNATTRYWTFGEYIAA